MGHDWAPPVAGGGHVGLERAGCFGKGHKLSDTMTSGFASHELDKVKDAMARLVREGILPAPPIPLQTA